MAANAMTVDTLETFDPQISEWIQEEIDSTPKSVFEDLVDVEKTNRLRESVVTYMGLVPMHEVAEMQESVPNQYLEGWRTDFIRRNWRDEVTWSKILLDTDLSKNVTKNRVKEYTRNVISSRNLYFFGLLRNAFVNSGLYAYAWGKPLASIAIPRKDGNGTYASTFYDGVQRPLGYTAVDLARQVIADQVSDVGNLLSQAGSMDNMCIVCSKDNAEVAFQIAGTNVTGERPDTADRATNYFRKGANYDVLVTEYVGYNAAKLAGETTVTKTSASNYYDSFWALLDMKSVKKYWKFYEQEGYYYFDTEINKKNEAVVEYSYDAYAFGITSPIGGCYSRGDQTTVVV